jgi:hypothetical protein
LLLAKKEREGREEKEREMALWEKIREEERRR